jgi:hypothetical protein
MEKRMRDLEKLMRAKLVRRSNKGQPGLEPWESDEVEIEEYYELGMVYDVLAVCQYGNRGYLIVISDSGRLDCRYSYYFELESMEIPRDWRIRIYEEYQTTLLGPAFIAEDYEFYAGIVLRDIPGAEKINEYLSTE